MIFCKFPLNADKNYLSNFGMQRDNCENIIVFIAAYSSCKVVQCSDLIFVRVNDTDFQYLYDKSLYNFRNNVLVLV